VEGGPGREASGAEEERKEGTVKRCLVSIQNKKQKQKLGRKEGSNEGRQAQSYDTAFLFAFYFICCRMVASYMGVWFFV